MGQALYRQYRPRKLSEVIGQEHITITLQNALKTGRISHAYLFTGPKGTGKTSVARIFAHDINKLPYTYDDFNIDIIEIDAASNRRIDEIRELREKIHTAPATAKFKVYIIDEVHMLTKEAFNALLKTLEEPPEHAIFILATTESHKLPDTIISRTQRHNFKPVDLSKVAKHLATIARAEKIEIDQKTLELIAEHGEGSFRDSISLLDQAASITKQVEYETVLELLGIPSDSSIQQITDLIFKSDIKSLIDNLNNLKIYGANPSVVAKQLSKYLRQQLVAKDSKDNDNLSFTVMMTLLKNLLEVPSSSDPQSMLEIAILSSLTTLNKTLNDASPQFKSAETSLVESTPLVENIKTTPSSEEVTNKLPQELKFPEVVEPIGVDYNSKPTIKLALWPELLKQLKVSQNTLYTVLRIAEPKFVKNELMLECSFSFHQKQISNAKNKKIIEDALFKISGIQYIVKVILKETKSDTKINEEIHTSDKEQSDISANIVQSPPNYVLDIFGSGIVIEDKE